MLTISAVHNVHVWYLICMWILYSQLFSLQKPYGCSQDCTQLIGQLHYFKFSLHDAQTTE